MLCTYCNAVGRNYRVNVAPPSYSQNAVTALMLFYQGKSGIFTSCDTSNAVAFWSCIGSIDNSFS